MSFNTKIFIRINSIPELFGISKSHCWSLISKGEIKSFKPSKKVTLIRVNDLVEYIEGTKNEN